MPGKQRMSSRVGNSPRASAYWDVQGDVMAARIGRRRGRWHRPYGRTGVPKTATMVLQEKKKKEPRSKYTALQDVVDIL